MILSSSSTSEKLKVRTWNLGQIFKSCKKLTVSDCQSRPLQLAGITFHSLLFWLQILVAINCNLCYRSLPSFNTPAYKVTVLLDLSLRRACSRSPFLGKVVFWTCRFFRYIFFYSETQKCLVWSQDWYKQWAMLLSVPCSCLRLNPSKWCFNLF